MFAGPLIFLHFSADVYVLGGGCEMYHCAYIYTAVIISFSRIGFKITVHCYVVAVFLLSAILTVSLCLAIVCASPRLFFLFHFSGRLRDCVCHVGGGGGGGGGVWGGVRKEGGGETGNACPGQIHFIAEYSPYLVR